MNIAEIQANANDLAGGEVVRRTFDRHLSLLYTLNVIDEMTLELSNSNRQLRPNKIAFTLASSARSGTIASYLQMSGSQFVRYRADEESYWTVLDVVQTIEALTQAENDGRQAIYFEGFKAPLAYSLSFTPGTDLSAELWGTKAIADPDDPSDATPFPREFGLVAAYRVADLLLNLLLAVDPGQFTPFVTAQKLSLAEGQRRVENVWRSFRSEYSDALSRLRSREYNVLDEDTDAVADGDFPHYRG